MRDSIQVLNARLRPLPRGYEWRCTMSAGQMRLPGYIDGKTLHLEILKVTLGRGMGGQVVLRLRASKVSFEGN